MVQEEEGPLLFLALGQLGGRKDLQEHRPVRPWAVLALGEKAGPLWDFLQEVNKILEGTEIALGYQRVLKS